MAPLIILDDTRYDHRHFLRTRNIFENNGISAQPFFQVDFNNAEGKHIPELRRGGDGADVIHVHWTDLVFENRSLIDEDHLVCRDDDAVVQPIDIGFQEAEKHQDKPRNRKTTHRPKHRQAESNTRPSTEKEHDGQKNIPQACKQEG